MSVTEWLLLFAAGLAGGTVNVMLPLLVIWALEARLSKTAMIQVFNFCFLLGKLTQGTVFFYSDLFTLQIVSTALLISAWVLGISISSMKIRDRINADTYRKWLRVLLAVMAGLLIAQTFLDLL